MFGMDGFPVRLYVFEYSTNNELLQNYVFDMDNEEMIINNYIANGHSEKVKLAFKVGSNNGYYDNNYYWFMRVFYLEKGENTVIDLTDSTLFLSSEEP